ncbi:MAG TPA: glycoside hydrolase family 57 protein [Bryobacteraceae bacterium]|jgi:alpha-amylase/alpha-mannosidase (GH57 family)|nr:glycoside hydrolase family 57 protein [Bryobacteraceae bacterium]
MPKINLCFLWHMHQPFYKDLVSGEYRLPWTRMHALKDYYGMVKILEEFPHIRQTFNLVPSMIVQVEEYAAGEAKDPFLACALKPAENLTFDEQTFILRNFFMANPERMIYRYPRYGELYNAWQARKNLKGGSSVFGAQEFRDLQVLSQLAWFDEEFQAHDPEVKALVEKGSQFCLDDQALMGRKQREICAAVIPEYKKLAASGQIEISTTPFYHPILPLLCDSDIASVSHPHVPLPPRFCYPGDARMQLQMARDYIGKTFGVAPVGLWPSEGSVSDHVLDIAASIGFEWAATDNGVLERTLRRPAGPDVTYRPWRWMQQDKRMGMIFRDHQLSDLIGFVYSGVNASDAAQDFLHRIRDNCGGLLASGRDAMVPIILDGENAWEYYDHNGRPFFRELYRLIQDDPTMEAITVSEAFRRMEAEPLDHVFPGSWIGANFDVWIGAEEDNKSWRLLLDAHQAFDKATAVPGVIPDAKRELARQELFIAEGSDWNWWYGPEHDSENRIEFDQIYREHLANVYRALGLPTPPELSHPILRVQADETLTPPFGPIEPTINGVVDSYFEWLGAGTYKVDQRSGSMHGKRALVKDVRYGAGGDNIFVCVNFEQDAEALRDLQIFVELAPPNGNVAVNKLAVALESGIARIISGTGHAAYSAVLELSVPAANLNRFRLSFWQDGLPIQAIPPQDFLEITEPPGWSA